MLINLNILSVEDKIRIKKKEKGTIYYLSTFKTDVIHGFRSMFDNVVAFVFQSAFDSEIYQNNIFLFLKNLF
jgi:hypothetical protein